MENMEITCRLFNPVCQLQVRNSTLQCAVRLQPEGDGPPLTTCGGRLRAVPFYSVIPLGSKVGQCEQGVQVSGLRQTLERLHGYVGLLAGTVPGIPDCSGSFNSCTDMFHVLQAAAFLWHS